MQARIACKRSRVLLVDVAIPGVDTIIAIALAGEVQRFTGNEAEQSGEAERGVEAHVEKAVTCCMSK